MDKLVVMGKCCGDYKSHDVVDMLFCYYDVQLNALGRAAFPNAPTGIVPEIMFDWERGLATSRGLDADDLTDMRPNWAALLA